MGYIPASFEIYASLGAGERMDEKACGVVWEALRGGIYIYIYMRGGGRAGRVGGGKRVIGRDYWKGLMGFG